MNSSWMKEFFSNSNSGILGEGLVINTFFDGQQYKLKHGGEISFTVEKNVLLALKAVKEMNEDDELRQFLDILEIIHGVLNIGKELNEFLQKTGRKDWTEDFEQASWNSALTKEDCLTDQFSRG